MPPRLYLFSGSHSLAFRATKRLATGAPARQQLRCITANEKPLPTNETPEAKGPNQDQLPHVSEEAGAVGEITGEGGPDLQQGTPVQEIFERDSDAQKYAPEVLKQDSSKPKPQQTPTGTRSYSTSTVRRQEEMVRRTSVAPGALESMLSVAPPEQGTKFGMVQKKLEWTDNFKHRYHPVVEQVTKMMMRSGKLAMAQRNMDIILNHIRTAAPPKPSPNVLPIIQSYYNPPVTGYIPPHTTKAVKKQLIDPANKPAVPNPPTVIPSLLPLDPVKYLELAIDSVAPLVKIRQQRGVLGGGQSLQVPAPLPQKQRRRTAINWILTAADRRKEVRLADRVAREIVNVMEGRSSVWGRREALHKLGISARSNVRFQSRRKR